jgi:hypothetical protein
MWTRMKAKSVLVESLPPPSPEHDRITYAHLSLLVCTKRSLDPLWMSTRPSYPKFPSHTIHGPFSEINCHPVCSDDKGEFCVVHNGIVTNSAELRLVLQKRGYEFKTETDTEAVAILIKYIYDSQPDKRITFTELVKAVLKELEGSFTFVFKSIHFPHEVVTARRGSPPLDRRESKPTRSSKLISLTLSLLARIMMARSILVSFVISLPEEY